MFQLIFFSLYMNKHHELWILIRTALPIQMSTHNYSWLSLSRPHLSRMTAYLKVKIWSLPKHEDLTSKINIVEKRNCSSPLFHNIFNISLTSRDQLHIKLLNVVVQIIFSSILQCWYFEVQISRSISESPLEFEIMSINCMFQWRNKRYLLGTSYLEHWPWINFHNLKSTFIILNQLSWKYLCLFCVCNRYKYDLPCSKFELDFSP